MAVLFAASLGLPSLWLMWAAYQGPRRYNIPVTGLSMAQVADQLAVAVGAQWSAEAAKRRLHDTHPLIVSWTAADASLSEVWDPLVELRTRGSGRSPPSAKVWSAGPDDLAGQGGALVEVLARVPTGRLVVLGEPGAGKTTLMVRLVLDLLGRRADGDAVPIMASVASWNPAARDLRGWLVAQLLTAHPGLANPPPVGRTESTQAEALLAAGLILPILDGLDEIPEQLRSLAVNWINETLRPGERVVVTCRTRQYQDAVQPSDGVGVIRRAAAVQLRPLDAEAVRNYLCDDSAGPVARARWDPVLKVLDTDAPVARALRTPLMVGLAHAIYNPRPGELAGTFGEPAELCSPVLADQTVVESLLLDAFLPAAYLHSPVCRWKVPDAERWLVFVARYLERTITGPDLAWWQLPLAVPRFAAASGVVAGAAIGAVAGVIYGLEFGITAGAVAGAVAGVGSGAVAVFRDLPKPVRGIRLRPPSLGSVAFWGCVGVVSAVVGGIVSGIATGIVAAVMTGPGLGFGAWVIDQRGAPLDLGSAARPVAILAEDRRAGTALGALFGVVAGAITGVLFGAAAGLGLRVVFGVMAGVAAAVICSFAFAAWPSYGIARIWLALRRRLPWSLMSFLADAHRRGVLRQSGAVYQFRHIELQHRLGTRP